MENKKKLKKSILIPVAIGAVLLFAGVSVYAAVAPHHSGSVGVGSAEITKAEAEDIALSHVKGAEPEHITLSEKSSDNGRNEYDIEIVYDGCEYDFEIAAKDGKILEQSKELIDDNDIGGNDDSQAAQNIVHHHDYDEDDAHFEHHSNSSTTTNGITVEKAKSIALANVSGATASDIMSVHEDCDDGVYVYEIEIHHNGYEYDFEIDKNTGNILDKDVDYID